MFSAALRLGDALGTSFLDSLALLLRR